jgi:flagellar basal-body rod protein FlgG
MAITALHSASTALNALSTEIDIIANNLANANTHGFKTVRANFEDLMYQQMAQPGVETAEPGRPSGLYVGLGTRISNTQIDFSKGAAIQTTGDLDMMIDGDGLFQVTILDSQGEETNVGYTRLGNFLRNRDGEVVLGTADGPRLEPPIVGIPEGALIDVMPNGEVIATVPGEAPRNLGRIELATFVNPGGLKPIGGSLYVETAASGPPIPGEPGEGTFGLIRHKYLEGSNVDAVRELVNLIKTQRTFEMNSQTIQTADEALQVVSNLRRF